MSVSFVFNRRSAFDVQAKLWQAKLPFKQYLMTKSDAVAFQCYQIHLVMSQVIWDYVAQERTADCVLCEWTILQVNYVKICKLY